MNCIIVDDDELSRAAIKSCVERTDFLKVVEVCKDAMEAHKAIKEQDVDLIFLDVEMPEMSGMEFIRNIENIPQVIVITAKKDYAAEAFDYNVTDYIVKPIQYARFLKAVEKARKIQENVQSDSGATPESILIKQDSKLIKLDLKDIIWIEAFSDYVNIYTPKQRYTVLPTMKAIENKLPSNDFMRVHRSYIVRLDRIEEIEENTIVLGDKLIPVSRSNKDGLIKKLNLL